MPLVNKMLSKPPSAVQASPQPLTPQLPSFKHSSITPPSPRSPLLFHTRKQIVATVGKEQNIMGQKTSFAPATALSEIFFLEHLAEEGMVGFALWQLNLKRTDTSPLLPTIKSVR